MRTYFTTVSVNLSTINVWMDHHNSKLAKERTEAFILKGPKEKKDICFNQSEIENKSSKTLKLCSYKMMVLSGTVFHYGIVWWE